MASNIIYKRYAIYMIVVLVILFVFPLKNTDAAQKSSRKIDIGIIIDTETEELNALSDYLLHETSVLLGKKYQVSITEENVLECDWSASCINKYYDKLVRDQAVDIIVGIGVLTGTVLAQKKRFEKPVVLWGVVNPKFQRFPHTSKGKSGVHNLTYILYSHSVKRDLTLFHDLFPFKNIGLLADEKIASIVIFDVYLSKIFKKLNTEYRLIPIKQVDDLIADFPEDVDAVYFGGLYRFSQNDRKRLIEKVNAMELPSFSLIGEGDVKLGVMAASAPETSRARSIRRCALRIEMIVDGKDPADFRYTPDYKEKLTINMTTARKVGFSPRWDIISEAELINMNVIDTERVLDLIKVVSEALELNLDIQTEKYTVESGIEDVKQAKSQYFPMLDVSATATVIDEDRAVQGQAEKTTNASASLNQLIYSDQVNANFSIQKHLLKTLGYDLDETTLDIILKACTAYFDVLKAKTNLEVVKSYVNVNKRNLEISQYRESVGYSGASDVYRWQSELATAKQNLILAQTQYRLSKIQLNQVINRPLNEEFILKDTTLDDPVLKIYGSDKIIEYLGTPEAMKVFSRFLIEEANKHLPEIKQINESLAAQERMLLAQKRRRYVPNIGLKSNAGRILNRDGTGSEIELPSDTQWDVGVGASWSLYQGGEIGAAKRQALVVVQKLKTQKENLIQNLELRILSRVLDLISKSFNLDLTKVAADAANKSLKLVQDSYMEGTVSIVNLMDAQNAALKANQAAMNSVYDYYLSVIYLDRSVGSFHMIETLEEQRAFFNRFRRYMEEH